jgi:valyl-tRNA synthetase
LERLLYAEPLERQDANVHVTGVTAVSAIGQSTIKIEEQDKGSQRDRLDKEIAKVEADLRMVEGKLNNKSFVDRAPRDVVELNRQRHTNFSDQLKKLREARDKL